MNNKLPSPRILLTDGKEPPNPMYSDMHKDPATGLWIPNKTIDMANFWNPFTSSLFNSSYSWMGLDRGGPAPIPPDEATFEVNMVEALEGWRAWRLEKGKLGSMYTHGPRPHSWLPDVAAEAHCTETHEVPAQHCHCGFYAGDDFESMRAYTEDEAGTIVFGRVSGWGRYVRGGSGWRAQFCYPKSFHVLPDITPDELESLKLFHVPIFMDQPVLMYNPEEDGYEYGDDEADRNFRAGANSNADEEDDED